jgi:hypothetical protein
MGRRLFDVPSMVDLLGWHKAPTLRRAGDEVSINYHGGDGNDVVLTALGHATVHALHHAAAASNADLWFG